MKTTYRIYHEWSLSQKYYLKQYGFNVGEGYTRIDIVSNDKNQELLTQIDEWGLQKFYWTDYDKKDYLGKSLFVYAGSWTNGYPMPDNDGGYLSLTYNLDKFCSRCGAGKEQSSSFRLRSEPKWGNKMIFDLNWIYDEIFIREEGFQTLQKKFKLQSRKVLLYKKDTVLKNTVQLVVPTIGTSLKLEKQPYEICDICQVKKYSTQMEGLFPGFSSKVDEFHIFKSQEYFGSGKDCHRKIFISKELWNEMLLLHFKLNVWPVEP